MAKSIVFIDTEVGVDDHKIHDIGAVRQDRAYFHSASVRNFVEFIAGAEYICGHNILHHDLKYIHDSLGYELRVTVIDTLYLSPLLFPKRPYHALLKDDKLQTEQLNDPVNDCQKAASLFYDEVNAFFDLPPKVKQIFCCLLYDHPEFSGFFQYVNFRPYKAKIYELIHMEYEGRICTNADLLPLIRHYPVELAYALALIGANDEHSITPPWLLKNYPKIENVIKYLRGTPCANGCTYCHNALDIHRELKRIFGYDSFRTYNGEPLQEKAAQAAVDGKSVLAVFPTGGGKSITFQLPALMAGKAVHGLTVVISPLQSLMKDQVDNLNAIGINEAVTVNGLLDPIERANALERVANGSATLLYISPEQLRSRTIEKLLVSRNVARFVIDEAHCFSAWGQDFRVDYLYIGDFIRELQKQKTDKRPIPVSCFTATAKQKVISDICGYFKRKLDLDLEIFASSATRENLHYTVLYKETDDEKYAALRDLIAQKNCPTIVYVSRTKRTHELAEKLTNDGFPAKPFNGKMDSNGKIANQESFIRNEIKVIVATSAFGMGVDKKDVKLVIHYDISSSLEDYVQEAGRAGRDPSMQAECYVLFNDNDLDKHFLLLNQTKLSISEIQQVWKAIKDLTKFRSSVCCSPLEIARQAGWDDSVSDIETRVKTAVSALENAGYVKRGRNMPHVYATSILARDMREASFRIDRSALFSDGQRTNAKRIIKSLISSRSIAKAGNDDAESRIDYLADILGMTKDEVINCVNLMRQDGLLADSMDMSAYIFATDTENKSTLILEHFATLEHFLLDQLTDEGIDFDLKDLNERALAEGIATSSVKKLRTLLYFLTIKSYVRKSESGISKTIRLVPSMDLPRLETKYQSRIDICHFILELLYAKANQLDIAEQEGKPVQFSLIELYHAYIASPNLTTNKDTTSLTDIEDALLYLSKIGALKLEGGFLVLYNGMEIKRLITDNRIKYKVDDYRFLDEFYKQKIRQIHIVGEYANLMVRDYQAALQFVQDYFQMDFRKFVTKYFIVALANSFAKTIQDRMKLAPVEAVREDCGIVRITHHHEKHMETAVVNEVISTQGNSQCCILTNTNDEALRLLGLLTKSGIRAKLIQSLDGFRLYNLVEVRYFLKKIDAGLKSPVISNDLWNRAKEHLFDAYAGSPCLEICGNLIRDFEETNPTKYRTDLEEFIRESNYEDFYPDDHEIVFISTIHKAKGREFDTVYMMLDGNTAATDEEKRKLYVGMTRAKNALYIHCNTELFSAIAIPEIEYIEDQNCYEEPTELTLQLTHRDVVLDFFKGKKELLLKLRSGMALSLIDCYLLAKLNGKTVRIAKLSKACKDRIESLLSKGYCPVSAEIRFIVAWKKEGDADETPVVLPDIHFQKELSIK